jgi:hypothetical protein
MTIDARIEALHSSPPQRESPAGVHVYGSYLACPRLFYFKYVLGWTPEKTSKHFINGAAVHEGVELLYAGHTMSDVNKYIKAYLNHRRDEYESLDLKAEAEVGIPLRLEKWAETWLDSDLERYNILALEEQLQVRLPNDAVLTIRPDRILEDKEYGHVIVSDTKTSSFAKLSPYNDMRLSDQGPAYLWGVKESYPDMADRVQGILVDTIFMSGKAAMKKDNIHCLRPDLVQFSPYALEQFALGMVGTIAEIGRKVDLLQDLPEEILFPRAEGSCTKYGNCPFLSVCRKPCSDPDAVREGYKRDSWAKEREASIQNILEEGRLQEEE